MTVATSRQPSRLATEQPSLSRNWLAEIQRETKARPSAIVLYGPPGIGKTSFAAASPKPVFMIDDQEDGINTLKASKLIAAEIPVLPAVSSWSDAMSQLDSLNQGEHQFGSLVIDTIGGLERLCHEHVCQRDFKGDWSDKGFGSYAKGYEVSLPEWRLFLNRLDRLRTNRSMMIVCLAHSLVKPYKNPEGEDYDRFVPDLHHKTWSVTHKWADMILFANYHIDVEKTRSGKTKGKGGQFRFLNTEHHAAYDAKHRHGLPPEIEMGDSGKEAWANLASAIAEARKGGE